MFRQIDGIALKKLVRKKGSRSGTKYFEAVTDPSTNSVRPGLTSVNGGWRQKTSFVLVFRDKQRNNEVLDAD